MTDTDPNKQYADARASLRDTARWMVTILGATVVLVIGGGLIAKIADLDWEPETHRRRQPSLASADVHDSVKGRDRYCRS